MDDPRLISNQDTYVSQWYADRKFSTSIALFVSQYQQIGDDYRSLLQFDLSSLPSSVAIEKAEIELIMYRNEIILNTIPVTVHRLLDNWLENSVTWNNQPPFSPIPDGSVTISNDTQNGPIRIDITALAQGWFDGTISNNGILVKGNEQANSLVGFRSTNYIFSSDWPRLILKIRTRQINRWYYNLFATDGFINLPTDPTGTAPRTSIYVFGFVCGLVRKDVVRDGTVIATESFNPQYEDTLANREALRGTAVIPSPLIEAEAGDEIYIRLVNLGMLQSTPPILDVHTIHLHGAHVATHLDGFPETSFGVPVTPVDAVDSIHATYYFNPTEPGTYMYHCHQEAAEHVQMGMYGALIVYPSYASLAGASIGQNPLTGKWYHQGIPQAQIPTTATNRNFALNDIASFFDSDWIHLLSDIDSFWHNAVLTQDPNFNPVNFKPDYWLVNGRAFPDTLLPTTLPPALIPNFGYNVPPGYESYVKVSVGDKFLIRLINLGYQPVPWHTHGWHGMIIAKDANTRLIDGQGEMGFTVLVGSGETYDVLFSADDKRDQYADYVFCGQGGLPSIIDQIALATQRSINAGTFIPPYPGADDLWTNIILAGGLGLGTFLPPYNWAVWNYGDPIAQNLFYPQFYPAHNHDDYKVTNNGVYPGGQLTLIETDFPASDYTATPPVITEPPWVCP
ncbi:MAG: DNRLRE domain-containing protein [Bacillota bacterium]